MNKNSNNCLNNPTFTKLFDIVTSNKLVCFIGADILKRLKLKNNTAPNWINLLTNIVSKKTNKNNRTWLNDPNFIKLCDIVTSNKLVCFTGAGISKGLNLKNNNTAPDWKSLLTNIKDALKNSLSDIEIADLDELLCDQATGEHLIEAASILCKKDRSLFLETLVNSVDLEQGETSQTHEQLLYLEPRGILTYNYDIAHENAIKKYGCSDKWEIILPSDNGAIINALQNNLHKQFLFKMHGSILYQNSMVLTRESYRDLLVKFPYYKSFIQQILTNYQLLIIGFGFSDPDFEMLLQDMFSTFGSPIQEHIVIKHIKEKSSKDVIYRLRYGLNYLYVNDFSDIPQILNDCMHTSGNIINNILTECISVDLSIRTNIHRKVRELSNIGKKCLANKLEEIIKDNIKQERYLNDTTNTITSEYVYTYGVIASSSHNVHYKKFLINEVINKSSYSETIAHALHHLSDILEKDDIKQVEKWQIEFKNKKYIDDPQNPDLKNRILKYCESIYYLLKAKFGLN